MDLLGVGALGLVAVEWLALGWLSGVDWPRERAAFWAPRWSLRLLVGSFLVGLVQLALASIGVGFANIALVLGVATIAAGALRLTREKTRTLPDSASLDIRERVGWLVLGGVLLLATLLARWLIPTAAKDSSDD